MDESLKSSQERIFHKLWEVLYSDKDSPDAVQDPRIRQAIRRIYEVVSAPDGDYELVWEKIDREIREKERTKHRLRLRMMRYAALFLLPLLCGGIAWYVWRPAETGMSPEMAGDGRPRQGIVLTLGNGQRLNLQEKPSGELWETATVGIRKDSLNGIVYEGRGAGETTAAFHTLEIPVAADYRLRLSDGTVVYLNSGTTLRYPEVFAGNERKVYLEGEAYFEVAEDSLHPFKVIVDRLEVEVLGTHFNVNAYPEQRGIATTLAEGKVRVTDGGREVVLRPGEQAWATDDGLQVREVDVKEFTGWKDGLFRFRQMPLKEMMIQVYRWYGVEADFADKGLETITFTGVINKNLPAGELFRIIESVVDVRFTKDRENHVMITTK